MPWWLILILFVYAVACMFLIFVILIQSGSKGGGLSSLGSASQGLSDALGATGAEKTLNNLTTYAAVAFIAIAIFLSFAVSRVSNRSEQLIKEAPAPAQPLTQQTGTPQTGLPEGVNVEIPSEPVTAVPAAADAPTSPAQ